MIPWQITQEALTRPSHYFFLAPAMSQEPFREVTHYSHKNANLYAQKALQKLSKNRYE
jgi:hypothetical protein